MAYDHKELEKLALSVIEEHDLVYVEEVVAYLPCAHRTFYDAELHKLPSIKEAIYSKKIELKSGIRKEWKKSSSATEKVALYKILGNEDERAALNGNNKQEHQSEVKVVVERKIIGKDG